MKGTEKDGLLFRHSPGGTEEGLRRLRHGECKLHTRCAFSQFYRRNKEYGKKKMKGERE
jgi:hypothetical protein